MNLYKKVYIANFTDAIERISSGHQNTISLFGNKIKDFRKVKEVVLYKQYDNEIPMMLKNADIKFSREY